MESFNDESDKKIFLSAGENEGFALVKVEDNGPGIPGELKNQVFSPFFSTKKRGSGLGLSFARQVMNLHGGEISVSSEKGKTIFSLSFPDNGGVRISDTGV
jgi:signal transduction histidine kinase